MRIDATGLSHKELNQKINVNEERIVIDNCVGQRYIASGFSKANIIVNGTPGNALGAYLDGATITVNGNTQDAVGDTMNEGTIIIQGNAGDALGYSMRGGRIYVKGNSGYRTGIHMKEFEDKKPIIIVGGSTGSFLGEYLAGGIIIVLGLRGEKNILGNFTGTGMHGGKIFVRTEDIKKYDLPEQVVEHVANEDDLNEILGYLSEYTEIFNMDLEYILKSKFYVLSPNAKNPYKRLYTYN